MLGDNARGVGQNTSKIGNRCASQSRLETWLSTRGDKYILDLQLDLYSGEVG